MTRVIVIASGKGGVGKTTLAANLAVSFSLLGKNTGVLDADIVMANLEIILGLKNPPVALIDVLQGRLSIEEVMFEGPGGVKIIPAGITLDGFSERNMEMLKASLREIPESLDILVIDAPAGRDAAMVMDLGFEVAIVTTPQVSSISDALKMKILAERMGSKIIGSIVNMVENKGREVNMGDIENALDAKIIGSIRMDESVKEALAYEIPYVIGYPNSNATKDTMALASFLIGREYIPRRESVLSKLFGFLRPNEG